MNSGFNVRKGKVFCIILRPAMKIGYTDNRSHRRLRVKPSQASTSAAKPNIHGLKLLIYIWWDQLDVVYYELLNQPKPSQEITCPVGWGCRIHRLHLCRGIRLPQWVSWTQNNLMVRFQYCWSFGECRVPLHCHRSQVHSGLE